MNIATTQKLGDRTVFWRAQSGALLEQLQQILPFDQPPKGSSIAKGCDSRLVVRIEMDSGQVLFIKRYRLLKSARRAVSLIHASKSEREWRITEEAQKIDIPVPAILAMAEVRKGPLLQESYLVQEAIEPCVSLESMIQSKPPFLGLTNPENFISYLIQFIIWVQQRGFKHDDFRSDHILVREPIGSDPQFVLIDLDNARVHGGALGFSDIVHNLVQLNRSTWRSGLSAADRLRFLREFIKVHPRLGNFPVNRLWRRIAFDSALRRIKPSRPERYRLRALFGMNGQIPEHLRRFLKEGL